METQTRSRYCFRDAGQSRGGRPATKKKAKKKEKPEKAICCKACGHSVTYAQQKIAMSGSHAHTFFNPAGIVYELGCFKTAPGCSVAGEPTSEFTWFAGYLWSFAFCKSCRSHLGWYFEQGENGFFGLILNRLKE